MANGVDRHVIDRGRSRRCRRVWSRLGAGVVPAQSPTAEQDEKAGQGGSDHRAWRGEDPMIEWNFFGQFLGLLGHGVQLIEKDLGVEFARDPGP